MFFFKQNQFFGRKAAIEVSLEGADFNSNVDVSAVLMNSDGSIAGGIDDVVHRYHRGIEGIKTHRIYGDGILTIVFDVKTSLLPKDADCIAFRFMLNERPFRKDSHVDNIKVEIFDAQGYKVSEHTNFTPRCSQQVLKLRYGKMSYELLEAFGHPLHIS